MNQHYSTVRSTVMCSWYRLGNFSQTEYKATRATNQFLLQLTNEPYTTVKQYRDCTKHTGRVVGNIEISGMG